mgnify:CR=1 FL=1
MHSRRGLIVLGLLVLTACGSGAPDSAGPATDAEKDAVEEAVHAFFDAIYGYHYDSLRNVTTSDFELVEDTLVMSTADFVEFSMPYREKGITFSYELSDFNTEIRGSVGWTRWRNDAVMNTGNRQIDLRFLESAVLVQREDEWKIDRLQSTPLHGR